MNYPIEGGPRSESASIEEINRYSVGVLTRYTRVCMNKGGKAV